MDNQEEFVLEVDVDFSSLSFTKGIKVFVDKTGIEEARYLLIEDDKLWVTESMFEILKKKVEEKNAPS